MAYRATINGNVFFNTNSISQSLGLLRASLTLKAGSSGLFSFTVAQKNKYYDEFHLLSDYIDFYRDDELLFSGRVSSIEMNFDLTMNIEAEGLLSILNDTVFRPLTHEGTLYQLIGMLISSHNSQVENAKRLNVGMITVPDEACYRAFENYESTYSRIKDLIDSYGGYPSIRKTNGALYFDWYQNISTQSGQSIDFGENEIDVKQNSSSKDYISVLIPLGAQLEDEGTGVRSRVTIETVNGGKDYIEDPGATNKIVGVYTWDDITLPSNLLAAGEAYLENQAVLRTTIKVTAVDLADAGYSIDHFRIGTIIRVTSRPHGLDDQTFECLEQNINPLNQEGNNLTLGGVVEGFTIKAQKEAKLNTKVIEKIEANYATNKRFNDLKTTLEQDIQENYTLIEQNSEQIRLLASEVVSVSRIFYEMPVPPYKKGDLWYRGADDDDNTAGVPGYAIPGLSSPGVGGDLFVATRDRGEDDTFNADDWAPVYKGQFEYINKRVSRAEISIDGAKADINLQASQVESLTGRMSQAEIDIDGANAAIALKVDNSDYNGASIVAKINGAGSSVSINADKINLNGVVTANNYFKINADGSMETIAGHIGGFEIDTVSIRSAELNDNAAGSIAISKIDFSRELSTRDAYYADSVSGLRFAIGSKFAVVKDGTVYCSELNIGGLKLITADTIAPPRYGNIICDGFRLYGGPNQTIDGENIGCFTATIDGISRSYLRFGITSMGYSDTFIFGVGNTGNIYSSGGFIASTGNVLGGFSISSDSTNRTISLSETDFTPVSIRSVKTSASGPTSIFNLAGTISATKEGQLTCVSLVQTSDRRLKTSIKELDIEDSADFVYSLIPYSFEFINSPGTTHHGFIADQLVKINSRKWDLVRDDTENEIYKTVAYTEMIADLVATVQSQNKRITALEEKGGI